MSSARILILTGSHLCRNPRVVKEASALASAGHAVTVLGVRSHRPSVSLDAEIVADARFRHLTVEALDGLAAFLSRARTRLARELLRRTGRELPAALGPVHALLSAARRLPADLVIAHTEPALWAAARLLADGRRVAADLEDWHSEDLLPEARSTRPLRLLQNIERALLHRAAYVTTTSQALSSALHARYGGPRAEVLLNAFPLTTPGRAATEASTAGPAFFWASQTLGPGRGLEAFLRAWSLLTQPSRVVLVGTPVPGYVEILLRLVPDSRRASIQVIPFVPPNALPPLIARHDIGLALEPSFPPNKDLTISNKILHYLTCGLAVLATPTAGQREVLAAAPEAGLLDDFTDPAASAARLDALLADPSRLAAKRAAARAAAEREFCWERQAPRLLALVHRSLSMR